MEYLLAGAGILLALLLVSKSQRDSDDYYAEGMKEYHRKMREIHGEAYERREEDAE